MVRTNSSRYGLTTGSYSAVFLELTSLGAAATPIGDEGTEERKHADVFLGHVVEPAIEALGLTLEVIRPDHIDKPGLITTQVIEHVLGARLVVADLSFHNPNVFYELALRHATGRPTVHISAMHRP
jgi:hypothetical protein